MAGAAAALPARVEEHLRDARLLRPGSAVLVALSGGLDSVVLLHLLRFPLRHLDLRLRAAHLDHGLRSDSAADAAWVRGLCRAWAVPLATARLPRPPASEAEGRTRRYRFLEAEAGRDTRIATAHHLDDQAETVLFRAVRGTGLRGLAGIRPRRGRIVRPLLPFGRDELRAYARAAGLRWREDPTNRDIRLARNRIRHVVLPELERLRPGAARALARVATEAAAAERGWAELLRRLEPEVVIEADASRTLLARGVLRSYHPAVRARVLRHVLRRYGSMPGRAGTHAALEFINTGRSGGQVEMPGGVRIEVDFDVVRVRAAGEGRERASKDLPVIIPGAGSGGATARLGGRELRVRWGRNLEPHGGERAVVPDGAAEFPLVLRGRRAGDRIRLAYGTKKLKKLLAERKLDRETRRRVPVLADARGHVLWVVGIARAEGVTGAGEGFEIVVVDAEQR